MSSLTKQGQTTSASRAATWTRALDASLARHRGITRCWLINSEMARQRLSVHHKAIGIAGMMLISIGSTTYMLLGRHLAEIDPASVSRTLQGFLSGIGFLGGAVIFKSGYELKGIKAAAAIWITGAKPLIYRTWLWIGAPFDPPSASNSYR